MTIAAIRVPAFATILSGYAGLMAFAYAAIFFFAGGLSAFEAIGSALVNCVPLFLLGLLFHQTLRRHVFGRPLAPQASLHLLLGVAFSLVYYWIVLSIFAIYRGQFTDGFHIRLFPDAAQLWQLLQGFTLFAFIAALSRAASPPPPLPGASSDEAAREESPQRLLLKRGDEIHPIETAEIVAITAADDYAEVVTPRERYLSRISLGQLEEMLFSTRFLRVHRSHVVNLDRLVRAEPAGGGRMLLHMENGDVLPASRAGARLLRERTI